MKQSKNSPQTLYQLPSSPLKPLDSLEPHIFSNSALFYEPTSVLDHHLTSSPAATAAAATAATATAVHDLPPLPWVADATLPLVPDENWPDDPVSSWLNCDPFDFHTPPTPPPPPPPVTNPNPNNSGFERSHFDLLIRAAHAIELCDLHSAHAILARLNPQLNSPSGSPLQRAAFYFKEALRSLVIPCVAADRQSSAAELVRRIAAHRDLSELSPLPQFANFTANQAIIDSLPLDLPSVHFIDFDLGLGGQWSSLIQELSERARAAGRRPPRVRLTAIVLDGDPLHAAEAAFAAENLRDFAATLGIRLADYLVRAGTLGLGGVRPSPTTEPTAVVLSPAALGGLPETTSAVMQFVRCVSPRVVVFVDTECGCGDSATVMVPPSFQRSFLGGLEHYAAVLESLDAAAAARDAGEDSIRRVERAVMRPKIEAAVLSWASPSRPSSWSDFFAGSGFAPAQLSELAESQAEWLLRRCAVGGFRVSRRHGALLLSWHGKELAATSAWTC